MSGTPAQSPGRPGSLLDGRFSLEDLLDETGGARLWRATDRVLARSVAVHVIPESDPRAEALLAAARTSALVADPRLLRVLDAAATDGVVYVVNEWGSGVTLDRLLEEGPLSPRRAAWVVREVAETISAAHRNGVAHGRLLPENVMVTETGAVKLIGFVVDAVLRTPPVTGPEAGDGHRLVHHRVTGGDPVGVHESDVLNLAGLLYAALVGRWPGTRGSSLPDAPAEHGRPLRPRQVRAGVPRPLDAICERVLNGDAHPHGVPVQSAHEIRAALSDFLGESAASAPMPEPMTEPMTEPGPARPAGTEPTALIAADEVSAAQSPAVAESTADVEEVDTGDLDATQAGVPDFESAATEPPDRGRRGGDWADQWANNWLVERAAGSAPPADAPPPPALPDPPARPLYADEPPTARAPSRAAAQSSTQSSTQGAGQRTTGAGNGWVPDRWGPDVDTPGPEEGEWSGEERDERVPGRSWLMLAVAVAVLLAVGSVGVLAFNLGRGPGGGDTSAGPTPSRSESASVVASRPVPIAQVTDFDPQGDPPRENPELAALAADGEIDTAWRTSTYYDPLDQLKDGVGLLVDLGERREVSEVRLGLVGSPTSLEVLAAPDADAAPAHTDDLETFGAAVDAGERANVRAEEPVTTQWLVVWLTELPRTSGGFQGQVAEISVRS